jgi:hypothetical protein
MGYQKNKSPIQTRNTRKSTNKLTAYKKTWVEFMSKSF